MIENYLQRIDCCVFLWSPDHSFSSLCLRQFLHNSLFQLQWWAIIMWLIMLVIITTITMALRYQNEEKSLLGHFFLAPIHHLTPFLTRLWKQFRKKNNEEETEIASETLYSESLWVPGKLLTETFYFRVKGGEYITSESLCHDQYSFTMLVILSLLKHMFFCSTFNVTYFCSQDPSCASSC